MGLGHHCSTCGRSCVISDATGVGGSGAVRHIQSGRHHGGLLIGRRQEVCKQMTTAPTSDGLRDALRAIADPASGKDIVTAGLVEGVELRGSLVQVALLTDRAHAEAMEPVRRAVEALLARQPGITNASA